MNDTQSLIGRPLYGEFERDAVHIAVAPVVAGVSMQPGTSVYLDNGRAFPAAQGDGVGIIDPYLLEAIPTGGKCWLFLYPNTITSLRHDWTHPAFAAQTKGAEMSASELWLRGKASEWGINYAYLMEQVAKGSVCFGDDDGPDRARGCEEALQFHAQIVLGREVPEPYFRCAC